MKSYSSCISRESLEHYLCMLLMLRLLVSNGQEGRDKKQKMCHQEWLLCWQQTSTGQDQRGTESLKAKQSLILYMVHSSVCLQQDTDWSFGKGCLAFLLIAC